MNFADALSMLLDRLAAACGDAAQIDTTASGVMRAFVICDKRGDVARVAIARDLLEQWTYSPERVKRPSNVAIRFTVGKRRRPTKFRTMSAAPAQAAGSTRQRQQKAKVGAGGDRRKCRARR